MTNLAEMHCEKIKAGSVSLNTAETHRLLANLPGWRIYNKDGEPRLEKTFKFKDYHQALAFTEQIGQTAIAEDHHPAILTEYSQVTVTWWTHRIKGLHQNDFIMATKTEQLYEKVV